MALPHPEVDPEMVDKIVCKLKSQGIFDQFRKDCLADVDSRPAYQNLRDKVNGAVASFLSKQPWRDDLNKNQIRETLRQNIQKESFLETGVNKIVEQVVNPRIFTVFMPKVEDIVYEVLGVEKPINEDRGHNRLRFLLSQIPAPPKKPPSPTPLPNDLEPISPLSLNNENMENGALNDSSSKINEETDNSKEMNKDSSFDQPSDSQLSGISDLSSHGSTKLDISESAHLPDVKTCQPVVETSCPPKTPPLPSDWPDGDGVAPQLDFDNFSNLKEKLKKADPLNKSTEVKDHHLYNEKGFIDPQEIDNSGDSYNIEDVDPKMCFDQDSTKTEVCEDVPSPKRADDDKSSQVKTSFNPFSDDSLSCNSVNIKSEKSTNESSRRSPAVDVLDSSTKMSISEDKPSEEINVKGNSINGSLREDSQLSTNSKNDSMQMKGDFSIEKNDISSRDSCKSVDEKKTDRKSSSHRHSSNRHSSSRSHSSRHRHSSNKDKRSSSKDLNDKDKRGSDRNKEKDSHRHKDSDTKHKDSKRRRSSENRSKDRYKSDSHLKKEKDEKSDKKNRESSKKEDDRSRKEERNGEEKKYSKGSGRSDGKAKESEKKEYKTKSGSKEDKERESRKRKRDKCNEESKKKENRRSKDRDDGSGGSSTKKEDKEKTSSGGVNGTTTGSSGSDAATVSTTAAASKGCGDNVDNAQEDSTRDSESQSDIDLILMRINSSIQECEQPSELPETKKKPKIANNIFEVKKIIEARKSFTTFDPLSPKEVLNEDDNSNQMVNSINVTEIPSHDDDDDDDDGNQSVEEKEQEESLNNNDGAGAMATDEVNSTIKGSEGEIINDFFGFNQDEIETTCRSLSNLNGYFISIYRFPSTVGPFPCSNQTYGKKDKNENSIKSPQSAESSYLSCLNNCNFTLSQSMDTNYNIKSVTEFEHETISFDGLHNCNITKNIYPKSHKREENTLKDKLENFVNPDKSFEQRMKDDFSGNNDTNVPVSSEEQSKTVTEDTLDNLMKENICKVGEYSDSDSEVDPSKDKNQQNISSPQKRCTLSDRKSTRSIQRSNQTQRYESSELYKPRPLFSSTSRRNRLANNNLCVKRGASSADEYPESKKQR